MKNKFVEVTNVARLGKAFEKLDRRGAREKQIVAVAGRAGLGKSRTVTWWVVHNDAVMITAKATATPSWLLRDLVRELGLAPRHGKNALFEQAAEALAHDPRPIVVDEVEHTLAGDASPLDILRALADLCGVPLILVGREGTREKLFRQPQIWTRIAAVAEFEPLTLGDVRLCCDELVEGEVADEVVAEVHRLSSGLIREVMQAIAEIDFIARRQPSRPVELADLDVRTLTTEWRSGRTQRGNVVALASNKG